MIHLGQLPEELILDILLCRIGNFVYLLLELLLGDRLPTLLLLEYDFLEFHFHLLEQGVDR